MSLKVFLLLVVIPVYILFVLYRARKVHPKGLFVLFFAEMWERMSYYGMRALLVLYMTQYLFTDPERFERVIGLSALKQALESGYGVALEMQPYSSKIYGLYTGLVYLSPFFGGILADRVWGKKKSVYVGALLMAIGHFLMGFENLFIPALVFLIFGNGAFKPNISTQVGNLYKDGDAKKDGAFTLFYMGINLGAFYSPFLCRDLALWICEITGKTDPGAAWHLGFTFAGIGMLIGTLVYHFFRHDLPAETAIVEPEEKHAGILFKTVGAFTFMMVGFVGFLMLPTAVQAVIIGLLIAAVLYSISRIKDSLDRSKVAALVILCVGTIAFWAIFEQQGNTLQLWADEKADWARFGLESTTYQSFNPAFIFLFAPLLDRLWAIRERNGKRSSSVRKMAVGCFLAGGAFLSLMLGSKFITMDKSLINMAWLTLATFIFTLGELYLSPIGLSFVTKVAPARFLSMMMGMWFLSSFIGNYLAGSLGALYSQMSNDAFFSIFAVLGIVVGFFFLIAERKLSKIVGSGV
ncbi:MAG: peptide MFS transporter [Bdellovibrionales bacterium]|nr:peptide MFS transporter [Bdellovibrionales bacterium]